MTVPDELGVALWTMQSTAAAPASATGLYRDFGEDAALAEELGFHSVWTAEHRGWYDGWCPAPLHALAHVAARTSRIRLGTAMMLLPQHDPVALAEAALTLDRLSDGRVELGVGLGHRDAEYDLLGRSRSDRGRRMDAGLDVLAERLAHWRHGAGEGPSRSSVWIGGMAPAAISRAARRQLPMMLPQTLRVDELAAIASSYAGQAGATPRLGALRDVWVEPDPDRARSWKLAMLAHYREEIGSWWLLGGRPGFESPDLMERQLARIADVALVGDAETVARGLADVRGAGVDLIVARPGFDFVDRRALHEQLARLAEDVVPRLAAASGGSPR